MAEGVKRSETRIRSFAEPEMEFQLMRALSNAESGGGAIGEIMATVAAIGDGGPTGWVEQFARLADRVKADADRRQGISARDGYLRAAEYYRSAEYFADPRSDEQRVFGRAARASFMSYAGLLALPPERLAIPFEGGEIGGYFFAAAKGPRPTLMALSGFDGTSEEVWLMVGQAARERGYHFLVFDGPGQMGARRDHPEIVFRPDYEKPISAVIDYALTRADVDPARLALLGISFGGYFAIRAAVHDHRIGALIANSPIVDLRQYLLGFAGGEEGLAATAKEGDFGIDDLPDIPDEIFPPALKANTLGLMVRFGRPSFLSVFEALRSYSVTDEELAKVGCPSLAMVGEGEGDEPMRQCDRFVKGVAGGVDKRLFTVSEGADAHCQINNLPLSRGVLFDWLDDRMRR